MSCHLTQTKGRTNKSTLKANKVDSCFYYPLACLPMLLPFYSFSESDSRKIKTKLCTTSVARTRFTVELFP